MSAKADISKNRLYLNFKCVGRDELLEEIRLIAEEVKKLRTGFTCLTQLWENRPLTEKEERYIRLLQEFLALVGLAKVVRVGPKSTHEQFDLMSREAAKYSAEYVDTLEQAEEILDAFRNR